MRFKFVEGYGVFLNNINTGDGDMGLVDGVIKVQDQLEEYGKLINALAKSDIQDFGVIVLQGGLVCESMLSESISTYK